MPGGRARAGTARTAREGWYNVIARPGMRCLLISFLTGAPGRYLQAMGGILVVLLVLFVVSFTGSGEGAANSEWRPQSQLQRSQRQADLYDDLTLEARTRGRGARDRLPPGARGQPAKAAGSTRSALPAESAENQAAYEDGDDEEAFIRMAQQQETEMMANELGTQRKGQRGPELRGQGSTRDRSTRVGAAEDYDEDDEDEQDQDAALPQPGTEQIQLFGQLCSRNRWLLSTLLRASGTSFCSSEVKPDVKRAWRDAFMLKKHADLRGSFCPDTRPTFCADFTKSRFRREKGARMACSARNGAAARFDGRGGGR